MGRIVAISIGCLNFVVASAAIPERISKASLGVYSLIYFRMSGLKVGKTL